MKKLILVPALFLLFAFLFPKGLSAKTTCNVLPGTIQCWRSWCDSGETKVCESLDYCFCYPQGETIQEGPCKGVEASPDLTPSLLKTGCSTLRMPTLDDIVLSQEGPLEGCPGHAINTAIGCIPIGDTNEFVGFILRWAIGIGGGIAFLLIVVAGFQIMSSGGNPEKLQAGKELMTSAITGVIMLIFSVFILKVIGIDILGLDKFGFGGG